MNKHPLAVDFQIKVTNSLISFLIEKFYEGDKIGYAEAKARLKNVELIKPNPEDIKEAISGIISPIAEWNFQLALEIEKMVKNKIEQGGEPKEVSVFIKNNLLNILHNTPVVIRKEGKREYIISADNYISLVSKTIPMHTRNAGYISRMKKIDAFSGWRSVCPADERSCAECMDNMEKSMETPFSWEAPHPPYHPNCRCRPIAVVRKAE